MRAARPDFLAGAQPARTDAGARCGRVRDRSYGNAVKPFWLRDGATSIRVAPRDVVWVSSAGNYVEYRLIGGAVHLIRATLAKEEPRLKPFGIVRVHRTRLVNLRRVIGVARRASGDFELRLDDGETVPCSRRYRAAISGLTIDGGAEVHLNQGTRRRTQRAGGALIRRNSGYISV